ncbi:toll/interleukin-1 receptor domain-containing protein [Actinoplanes sp. RD1]|uniref:toll/interleukin-1 receptor domain-containing protein n=1 Tax=Actinoplanes sp. RD1 TaxID=3064538 RepID=UPI0027411BFF|nr:toll/interleukin-1 receptor domain-containing protein [Actinoplanes sp. RD1]
MAEVFVSYRSADAAKARTLSQALRAAGHGVWFDEWRINLGDSVVERISAGLTGTAYLVLCYSSSGIDSPWMSREWMSSLARQLDGRSIKLLPVRLTGDAVPAILADLKYADLVADWDDGVRRLLAAIR